EVREANTATGVTEFRQLRLGDRVRKGQLLAVVWSKEFGEKKSQLIDALSQLRLDRDNLKNQEDLERKGIVPDRNVREARRAVQADVIAVRTAENTLRSWQLTAAEIETIKAEADKLNAPGDRDPEKERAWARVEVASPFDGVIVERNVTMGDIVDPSQIL